jgi:hypothetical protein
VKFSASSVVNISLKALTLAFRSVESNNSVTAKQLQMSVRCPRTDA